MANFQKGVWIGLGSNLGDSLELIKQSLELLDMDPSINVLRASGVYCSAALGVAAQPDFMNGVAELEVQYSPTSLLQRLLDIEFQLGRRRTGVPGQARPIDLDLLLFQNQVLNLPQLEVPHPRMHQRAFVLCPLAELSPSLVIPGRGGVQECLAAVTGQMVERISGKILWTD